MSDLLSSLVMDKQYLDSLDEMLELWTYESWPSIGSIHMQPDRLLLTNKAQLLWV